MNAITIDSLDALAHARQPLLDALAQIFTLYGWPEAAGRIYGLLRLEDDPLSLDEISDYLSVSKATASTYLRMLEGLYIVHRVSGPKSSDGGGRPRAYFDAERDSMKVIQQLWRHNVRSEIELLTRGINESRARLEGLDDGIAEDPELLADVRTDLEALESFEVYIDWNEHLRWLLLSVDRMQQFLEQSPTEESMRTEFEVKL